MYTLKMNLSGTMRDVPVPTRVITRVFGSKLALAAYLNGLLTAEENKNMHVELMTIHKGDE